MQRHGLEYEERKHGQLFCLHSAKDLLAILEEECALTGVTIRTRCDVSGVDSLLESSESLESEGSMEAASSTTHSDANHARYTVRCVEDDRPDELSLRVGDRRDRRAFGSYARRQRSWLSSRAGVWLAADRPQRRPRSFHV
jgi:hypothetical protein